MNEILFQETNQCWFLITGALCHFTIPPESRVPLNPALKRSIYLGRYFIKKSGHRDILNFLTNVFSQLDKDLYSNSNFVVSLNLNKNRLVYKLSQRFFFITRKSNSFTEKTKLQ